VREDDAERALRAACQMLKRLTELNVEFKAQRGVSLAIRAGVNTSERHLKPVTGRRRVPLRLQLPRVR
jgi:class 3 adenylate cyclase